MPVDGNKRSNKVGRIECLGLRSRLAFFNLCSSLRGGRKCGSDSRYRYARSNIFEEISSVRFHRTFLSVTV